MAFEPVVSLSELPPAEIEVHHRLWVHPECLETFDTLRRRSPLGENVPGLLLWRTLMPQAGSDEQPYLVVSVWSDVPAFVNWRDAEAQGAHAALVAAIPPNAFTRPAEVAIRVTHMEVR
jgi:heme-degrading monooxygenase HmoA